MFKKGATKKLLLALLMIFVLSAQGAFADQGRGGRGDSRGDGRDDSHRESGYSQHRHEVVEIGNRRYHYYDGRFYRPWFFGFGLAIASPPIGAVISFLPFGYQTIVVRDTPYYYYANIYYRPCPSGYTVVPEPITNPRETITINVPNVRGSYTPITLLKQGDGYIGPQGEYYVGNPTVEQLKALYGR